MIAHLKNFVEQYAVNLMKIVMPGPKCSGVFKSIDG